MQKSMLFLFAIVLWVAPAIVAGMLGWPGIWGGGSAFSDLIVPAPITGGILHVPSFVVMLLLASTYSRLSDHTAALLRAGLVAAALFGVAQLINIERLYLALSTDMQGRALRMHQNYFGLCLLTDASITWVWLTALRRPMLRLPYVFAISVAPTALWVAVTLAGSDRLQADFLRGRPGLAEQRGDGTFWVYTRLKTDEAGFHAAAEEFMRGNGPEQNVNVQDLAVYFTDSMNAARGHGADRQVVATLCLYEDGTPATWHAGSADCFSHHENFSEKLERLYEEQPPELPDDVRHYRIATSLCAGVTVPDVYNENEATNFCRHARLDEKQAELLRIYGEESLQQMLADD